MIARGVGICPPLKSGPDKQMVTSGTKYCRYRVKLCVHTYCKKIYTKKIIVKQQMRHNE